MKILSIETSCDETAISLLSISKTKIEVLGNALASQAKLHEEYGGVFPNLARREHQKNSTPLLLKVLKDSKNLTYTKTVVPTKKINNLKKILEREPELLEHLTNHLFNIKAPKIDLIAVTKGPGLEPALWVGISFAKALSELWGIPMIGVNHMEGHIASILLQEKKELNIGSVKFPALSLLVSGGHTELVLIKDWGKYKVIGQTKDDAVGEAFDKVARILGLPYPGGPQISALADKIRSTKSEIRNENSQIKLPRPMIHSKDFNFSYSGLKTAVLYLVRDIKDMTPEIKAAIAKEFEDAAIEVLIHKTKKAIEHFKVKTLIVGGGVSANTYLRSNLTKLAEYTHITHYIPTRSLSTDNAIMIAIAGYLNVYKKKKIVSQKNIKAEGHLSL